MYWFKYNHVTVIIVPVCVLIAGVIRRLSLRWMLSGGESVRAAAVSREKPRHWRLQTPVLPVRFFTVLHKWSDRITNTRSMFSCLFLYSLTFSRTQSKGCRQPARCERWDWDWFGGVTQEGEGQIAQKTLTWAPWYVSTLISRCMSYNAMVLMFIFGTTKH